MFTFLCKMHLNSLAKSNDIDFLTEVRSLRVIKSFIAHARQIRRIVIVVQLEKNSGNHSY